MQLNGVNSPTQRFMFSLYVMRDTQPETVKLRPMSQSKMQTYEGFMFFKYSANVDFPAFFRPKIIKDPFEFNIFGSMFSKGPVV